ncbi:hypothetical protein N0V90_000604 [Kalmusia sp. IMI 367209]|nr:hypothetical protein N0V90_000604 [Kalmusia sp. IMI 367209]
MAIDTIPKDDPRYSGCLDTLVSIKGQLYERSNELGHLDEGLRLSRVALDAGRKVTAEADMQVQRLISRSNLLGMDFHRRNKKESLDEAMENMCEAVALNPRDPCIRAHLFYNLAKRHVLRFGLLKDSRDLIESLKCLHRAVRLVPLGHYDRGKYLNELARAHLRHYDEFLGWDDLVIAFRIAKRAANEVQGNDKEYTNVLMSLGTCLRKGFERSGLNSHIESSIQMYEQVFSASAAPLIAKIFAAIFAGILHFAKRNTSEASRSLASGINLLEQLSTKIWSRDDQQHILKNFGGISARAAAVMLEANREPLETLQVLEQGRGIIIDISMGRRSDLLVLKEKSPELYHKYTGLCSLVPSEEPSSTVAGQKTDDKPLHTMRYLKDIERLEEHIEAQLGMKIFHKFNSSNDLQKLARFGPIVAFSTTPIRCDAFLVTEKEVKSIRLQNIRLEELETYTKLLNGPGSIVGGPESTRVRRNNDMEEFLGYLWKHAVRPVLEALLLFSKNPPDRLPRIWWIANDILGLAPLHAAGLACARHENTCSHVISSYIPTLKTLSQVRERSRSVQCFDRKALMVTAPKIKESAGELETGKDVDVFRLHLKGAGRAKLDILKTPSKAQVLKELNRSSAVFFACHGEVDQDDPANSGLLLREGLDSKPERLTFRELAEQKIEVGKLACLLACSTAANGNENLVDEMIHIVSGFQLAGFPHVIGSLWPVDDDITNAVFEAFVKSLSKSTGDDAAIALALHNAVNTQRMKRNAGWGLRLKKWRQIVIGYTDIDFPVVDGKDPFTVSLEFKATSIFHFMANIHSSSTSAIKIIDDSITANLCAGG